jgi:hypothetical protein
MPCYSSRGRTYWSTCRVVRKVLCAQKARPARLSHPHRPIIPHEPNRHDNSKVTKQSAVCVPAWHATVFYYTAPLRLHGVGNLYSHLLPRSQFARCCDRPTDRSVLGRRHLRRNVETQPVVFIPPDLLGTPSVGAQSLLTGFGIFPADCHVVQGPHCLLHKEVSRLS